jgi:stage V sporulation protein D (sporulation-specific penicillin-binding protein)
LIKTGLESNITIEVEADRTVKSQFPKAGEEVVKNSMVTLILN